MRFAALTSLIWLLSSCSGVQIPTGLGPTGDTGNTAGDDDDDDTTSPRADEGSVVVMQFLPTEGAEDASTVFSAMFLESRDGVLNLAQCVSRQDTWCADQWPADIGDSVEISAFDPTILDTLVTREVGDSVTFGPWNADYLLDSSNGLGFYFRSYDFAEPASGALDLSFGPGAWGNVSESGVLTAPTPISVTSHDPLVEHTFPSADPVPLRWTPGQSGEVYLVVQGPPGSWLYKLDDDAGAYDLDLAALGLADGDPVDLTLGRWAVADIDVEGRQLNAQVQINQQLSGSYLDIASRTELTALYDTCEEAAAAAPVDPGNYFGDFTDFGHHYTPTPQGCTGFDAPGRDAVIPLRVAADEALSISYRLESDDASLYLVTDCADARTCIAGSDQTRSGGIETISWVNDTSVEQIVWLHLDAFDDVTDSFTLDIGTENVLSDVLKDSCVEAIEQGPVPDGEYLGTMFGYSDLLDAECVGGSGGGEGVAQFFLLPGQTLSATATANGRDPKLYLLYNCAIVDSCFLGVDTASNATESIVYTNSTGASEFVYLAVDAALNIGDYVLDVEVQ